MKDTVWDNIYKDYLAGGKAWASINDALHPEFLKFMNEASFPVKNALDIGCGTGKYLKFLQETGFTVSGIDSSPSAIQMSKELLTSDANIQVADMYEYQISVKTYDFIISHCTLHHGIKKDVVKLLDQIYSALLPDGSIFISLPSNEAQNHWIMMSEHETLEDGTCIPLSGPEKGLAHSFYSRNELNHLFASYRNLKISLDAKDSRWIITALKR